MTTASGFRYQHPHHLHVHSQPSSSKPPKNPNPTRHTHPQNPDVSPIALSQQDLALSRATHLTHQELHKRRSHNLKQLCRCYRDHYWALMEELRIQYRDYYWKYGVSPFKEDQLQAEQRERREGGFDTGNGTGYNIEVIGERNSFNNGLLSVDFNNNHRCLFRGCKLKAMALTSFCHLHILSDTKQKLYKPCGYVVKSAQAGPITCGKPILRSTVPSLCTLHFRKAQKHVPRARLIQSKRRAARKGSRNKVVDKERSDG